MPVNEAQEEVDMNKSIAHLADHFQALTDAELVQVLQQHSDDYREEALVLAEIEADKRGGLPFLVQSITGHAIALKKKEEKETVVEEPSPAGYTPTVYSPEERRQAEVVKRAAWRRASNLFTYGSLGSMLVALLCYFLLFWPMRSTGPITLVGLFPLIGLTLTIMASLISLLFALAGVFVKSRPLTVRLSILLLSSLALVLSYLEFARCTT